MQAVNKKCYQELVPPQIKSLGVNLLKDRIDILLKSLPLGISSAALATWKLQGPMNVAKFKAKCPNYASFEFD